MKLNLNAACQNLFAEPEYYDNSFTLIGLKDYSKGTRVSPESSLFIGEKKKIHFLARTTDGSFMPYHAGILKTLKRGYLPVVLTDIVVDGAIRYQMEMFAGPVKGAAMDGMEEKDQNNFVNYVRVTMSNTSTRSQNAAVAIDVTQHITTSTATRRPLRLKQEGAFSLVCLDESIVYAAQTEATIRMACEGSMVDCSCELAPEASAVFHLRIPYTPVDSHDLLRPDEDIADCLLEVETYWEQFLGKGTIFEIPDAKAENTLKASIAYTFMTRVRGEIRPGKGFYDLYWTRDAAFINYAMQLFDYKQESVENLRFFWEKSIDKEGGFVSHAGQLDGTGQGLWGLYQYYVLSRDTAWLKEKYNDLKRAADWILKRRITDLPKDDPYYGLLPNSLADGECLWGGEYHIVGYDLWSLRGIKCFYLLAEELGETVDAQHYRREFDTYMQDVMNALDRAGYDYFPPSYEGNGTHWSNIKTIFPFPIVDKHDPRVLATMDRAEQTFVEGVCSWHVTYSYYGQVKPETIHPYMSTYITQTRLALGETSKVIEQFKAMLAHTTSTHGFPEGVYYEHRLAWNDTLPHIYGHATYMILLRRMMIYEEGRDLHLCLGAPPEWLFNGVRIKRVLTEFGYLDMETSVEGQVLRVDLALPQRNVPEHIYFYIPEELAGNRLTLHGEATPLIEGRKVLLPQSGRVVIEIEK